jgi:hypothetical protein
MDLFIENPATLWVFGGVTVEQHGRIALGGGTLDAQFVDLREGGMLTGNGTVRAEFENREGIIAPGFVEYVGELVIEGIFANRDSGTLAIELGGTTPVEQYDVLTVDGNAFLGGALEVSLVNPGDGIFRPQVGDRFEILRTIGDGEVLGTFDELLLPGRFVWDIEYFTDSVRLEVLESLEIPGDYNGNGQVEQADLDLVLINWGDEAIHIRPLGHSWISDPPSGLVDQDELDRVLLNWGNAAGQTRVTTTGGVPEPATFAIIAICVGVLCQLRQRLTYRLHP